MYLACLAYCYPPELTDNYYLSFLFAFSCPYSKCQANLCPSKSKGLHVKAVREGWQCLRALGIFTYFWRRMSSTLGDEGKEAGSVAWASDTTVLGGSTGDECRAPRAQSHTGPSQTNREGPTVPISFTGGSLNCGPQRIVFWQVAVSRPNSHWSRRLKKTWKGTLEQQDGHNNKPDTQEEQQPHRNTPP